MIAMSQDEIAEHCHEAEMLFHGDFQRIWNVQRFIWEICSEPLDITVDYEILDIIDEI